jgi:porin
VGYFYYNLSDDLQDELTPVGDRLDNEQGAEAYYSFAVTPWFFVTCDLEYVAPPRKSVENALIAGLRANIRF